MRRAAVDSARIIDGTIRDVDVGVGFREANKVVSDTRPADYVTDGIDDDVEIQNAINALTSGRTWMETVLVRGNFTIGSTIKLPDYTHLIIRGYLKLKDGFGDNLPMFQNVDLTEGNKYIVIEGPGTIDGNRANNPTGNHGIYISGSSDAKRPESITISNLAIKEFSYNAVRAMWPRNISLVRLSAFNISGHAFYYHQAKSSSMTNCYVDYSGLDAFAFSANSRTVASNLIIRETGRQAFSFDNAADCIFDNITVLKSYYASILSTGSDRCLISNVTVYESKRQAVELKLDTKSHLHTRFVNCTFNNLNTDLITALPAVSINANVAGREFLGIEFHNCKVNAPNCDYFIKETLTAGSISRTRALNCDIIDIGTAPLSFVANDSYAVYCPGYNPVGYISPDPTWGSSPWTYTNNDHVPEDIYISVLTEGDVSSITKDGQDMPLPGTTPTYICTLQPRESIVITYTTAGTLKRFGY